MTVSTIAYHCFVMDGRFIVYLYASEPVGQDLGLIFYYDYVTLFRVPKGRGGTGSQCLIAGGNHSEVCLRCTVHRSSEQSDTHVVTLLNNIENTRNFCPIFPRK